MNTTFGLTAQDYADYVNVEGKIKDNKLCEVEETLLGTLAREKVNLSEQLDRDVIDLLTALR